MNWELYTSKTLVYVDPGQFTYVYKAFDSASNHHVALKELHFATETERDQVIKEAEIMQLLPHPCVCQLYGMQKWQAAGEFVFCLAMEWLDNDLERETEEMRRKGERWGEKDAVRLLWEMTEVLAQAQKKQICHRDIKPTNLFRNAHTGGFKIADFGSAKSTLMASLAHSLAGTPQFLSPELRSAYVQYLTTQVCPTIPYNPYKSDVFALGLTVVYILKPELSGRLQEDAFVKSCVRGMAISEDLKEVLMDMLQENEAERLDFVRLEGKIHAKFSLEAVLAGLNESFQVNNPENVAKYLKIAFSWDWVLISSIFHTCEQCQQQFPVPELALSSNITVQSLLCPPCHTARRLAQTAFSEKSIEKAQFSPSFPPPSQSKLSESTHSSIGSKRISIAIAPAPSGSFVFPRRTAEDPQAVPQKCLKCENMFDLLPLADWRASYLGSAQSWKCVKVCSEACLQSPWEEREGDVDDNCVECGFREVEGFVLTCKRHSLCTKCRNLGHESSFLPGFLCPKCKDAPKAYLPATSRCTFLLSAGVQSYLRVTDTSNSRMYFLTMQHLKAWAQAYCHFCSFPIRASALAFFLYCGSTLNCVCSPDCLNHHMRRGNPTCPTCAKAVSMQRLRNYQRGDRLIMTSRHWDDAKECKLCKLEVGKSYLECGHGYCLQCLRGFGENYRDARFHCPFCGLRQAPVGLKA